jgi:AMP-binding enzyme
MSLKTTVALARRQSLADLLRRSAARHPDRVALSDGFRSRTYAELNEDASRIANALHERGIGLGDRVVLLSRKSLEYAQVIFGVARTGAVLVPVNFMLGGAEIGYVLRHSSNVALLVQDALADVAEQAIVEADASRSLRARVVLGGDREGWEPFAALLEHDVASEPAVVIWPDDPAQVLYTSGTESRPKGAVLAHSALIAQYTSCIVDGGMDSSDVELHAMPVVSLRPAALLPGPGHLPRSEERDRWRARAGGATGGDRASPGDEVLRSTDGMDRLAPPPRLRQARAGVAAQGVLRRGDHARRGPARDHRAPAEVFGISMGRPKWRRSRSCCSLRTRFAKPAPPDARA